MVLAPQGHWRLPPQQRVLRDGETAFDLGRVAKELSIVMTTSVGDFTPSTTVPLAALESLQSNIALRWCKKLLVFDKVPTPDDIEKMKRDPQVWGPKGARGAKWQAMWKEKRQSYEDYCTAFQEMKEANHPALFNVTLLFLPHFGHLFGTVKEAFERIQTRYVFVTQHDLRLSGKFVAADVQSILEVLYQGHAKYVVLNRDNNSAVRSRSYYKIMPKEMHYRDEVLGIELTKVSGYSDQNHFAEVDWYKSEVLQAIEKQGYLYCCMEHVLHDPWLESEEWKGTCLYGGPNEGPYVLDLVHGVQVVDKVGKVTALPPPPSRQAE